MMQRSTSEIAGWIGAAFFVALFAVANLLPIRFLWGFNFYSYLPPVWIWIALGVILVSALPPVAGLLMRFLERTSSTLSTSTRNQIITCAVVLCAFAALCWIFS
ncbi:MAG: hypothetical protein HY851_00340, partial [candidate division Zixibacteria bacterium]|nr:hypothetical protein [candidate division Zixibacteria bacterium]